MIVPGVYPVSPDPNFLSRKEDNPGVGHRSIMHEPRRASLSFKAFSGIKHFFNKIFPSREGCGERSRQDITTGSLPPPLPTGENQKKFSISQGLFSSSASVFHFFTPPPPVRSPRSPCNFSGKFQFLARSANGRRPSGGDARRARNGRNDSNGRKSI